MQRGGEEGGIAREREGRSAGGEEGETPLGEVYEQGERKEGEGEGKK